MTEPAPTLHRIPYTSLHSFPPLFQTYCTDYDAVASFYAGDFRSADARAEAARRAADHPRDRETLADILLDQNAAWGLDEKTRAHIEQLRDPASVAVVTGQQVGLLAGPLYTPYKTITALQLAQRLHEETGRPVVPVFWLEGEDHDFEEVAGMQVLRGNDLVSLRYTGHVLPAEGNLGPVGRLVLTAQIEEVLAGLEATLSPSDFKQTLMARVRAAYRPGTTLRDAFAHLMRAFFPDAGLVFISPDDARLKRLAAPLFRRELTDYAGAAKRLEAVTEQVKARFHAQVHPRPANLFMLQPEGRFPLDAEDGRLVLRGTGRSFLPDELLLRLDEQPERFSPNVVLRPLMQDFLLPTAAYVAGPGEVSYFAQFKPLYDWAEVPMPVIYPRASATLVESKVKKVMDRYAQGVDAFEEELDKLFRRLVLENMDVDLDAAFKQTMRHLHTAVNELKPVVEAVDRTLLGANEAMRATLMKEANRLKERLVKAEKRQHDVIREQLAKVQDNLFPGGKPQERAVSPLYFLNKYDLNLFQTLQETLSLDTTLHQMLDI